MNLKTYLVINELSQIAFAKKCNCAQQTIHNFCQRRRTPSLLSALIIFYASKKDVDLEQLLSKDDYETLQKFKEKL